VLEPFAEAALDAVPGIVRVMLETVAEPATTSRRVRVALQALAEAPDVALRRPAWPAAHALVETVLDLFRGSYVFAFFFHVLGSAHSPGRIAGRGQPANMTRGR
jgi:hypothetical protein